jgi:glucose 1-dehydrogenase
MQAQRLQGRFALITGASRGIGRAIAECFAQEGATVAINARHAEDAEETLKSVLSTAPDRPHCIVEADVGSTEAATRMIADVVARWGRLDILVNNAGIQAPTPGDSWDDETMQRIIAVNLIGAAACAREAIRHFLSRPGGGGIINTSSVHEVIPKPGYLAYSMSKGGMGNMTRTLALEFADKGIRVNAVAPGAILTSINDAWRTDPQAKANVESHIPMGYAATSEEIAPAFAFLASDEARYITGQTLFVDGGLTLYGDFKENWSS